MVIIIVGIVCGTMLLLCGGVVTIVAVSPDNPTPAAAPTPTSRAVEPAAVMVPTVVPTTAPPTSAAPAPPPTVPPSPAQTAPAAAPPPELPPAAPQAPPKATMPNVVGQNGAVAGDHLRKLGFTNIEYGSRDELDTWVVLPSNWTVTKQSHKAGKKVATDTLVVLTCTKTG